VDVTQSFSAALGLILGGDPAFLAIVGLSLALGLDSGQAAGSAAQMMSYPYQVPTAGWLEMVTIR